MYALKNKVQLIGNLGNAPEVKTLDGGKKMARFSMATNETYRDRTGRKETETTWHNVIAWGKVAEIAEKFLIKGKEVAIEGKLVKGVDMKVAEAAVIEEVNKLVQEGISEKELQKVKNKTESMLAFEDMSLMNRATNLAIYELLGDASLINKELGSYQAVTSEAIKKEATIIFDENNCNTLYYYSNN